MASRIYYIQEFIDDRITRLFRVVNPGVSEPGFYRAARSIESFRRFQTETWYKRYYQKGKHAPRRFSVRMKLEQEALEYAAKQTMERIGVDVRADCEKVPPIEAGTIFDFYALIAYNPKRPSFIVPNTEPNQ